MDMRECALCGEERPVERPDCVDGHGEDCPEAFCALCGTAIWVPALAPPIRRREHVAS
jgi:hypothetical protein